MRIPFLDRLAARRERLRDRGVITHSAEGIAVLRREPDGSRKESASVRWDDVATVTAYKRDLGVVDLICIAFARDDGTGLEVNEEQEGWEDLVQALPEHIPGITPWEDWAEEVVAPAFEPNETLLYTRRGKRPDPRG